jgi:Ulp1 family protease
MSVVVDYKDAILYDSDVELLKSQSGWLNDRCIHFFCKILECPDSSEEAATGGCFRFLDPSVVGFMKLGCDDDDEFQDLAHGLDIKPNENVVFLPINDITSLEQGDCTHWSLLVLFVSQRRGFHLDSLSHGGSPSKQLRQAERTAAAFVRVLQWSYAACPEEPPAVAAFSVSELEGVPQQGNHHDCGVFVLLFMHLLSTLMREVAGSTGAAPVPDPDRWREYLHGAVSPESARETRARVLAEIQRRRQYCR